MLLCVKSYQLAPLLSAEARALQLLVEAGGMEGEGGLIKEHLIG